MRKRICFLMDSVFSIGGVQRVTAVIAKEMAREHDVTIVTFDKPESKDTTLYGLDEAPVSYRFMTYPRTKWLRNKLCKVYSWCYMKAQPQWAWASALYARSSFPRPLRQALVRELQNGRYDVVIGVHAPLAARLATLKPKLRGVNCIGWIHNSFDALYGDTSAYIGPRRKRHYVYQLRKLDHLVVLCQCDAEKYVRYDAACRPDVIYNPLTLQPGAPSTGTSKRFLAVGRFTRRHKGIDLLIEAFSLFARQNADWHLDIVGEGVEEEQHRAAIRRHRLEDRITIHPFTKDIQTYYSQAQVYVLSSRWEGMPLVLVEAMSHGLPVVSSDLPVCKEIMGDFCLYFENGNVAQLADRLHEATQIDWQQKSAQARQIAARFGVAKIAEQWKEIL